MAEELKKECSLESKLIEGSGGVFDVVVDGTKIYTKSETGRFPNPGEVSALIKG